MYTHNHGVHTNGDGWRLDEDSTVQRHLRDAGYATALAGKFLNSFRIDRDPKHFDRWAMMRAADDYYGARFNINGRVKRRSAYSTNVISDKAVGFLRSFNRNRDGDPWFLIVTPNAMHLPATPEPKYSRSPVPRWSPNPATSERNRADKPPWVRSRSVGIDLMRAIRRRQFRTLRSVDDMILRLTRLLRRQREIRRTLIIFTSDNGYLWGEHGLDRKGHPYEASVGAPLIVRWPGHVAGASVDPRFASLVDIAPTIFKAARIESVGTDGRSLLGTNRRNRVFMEYWRNGAFNIPGWRAVRNRIRLYVEYLGDNRRRVIFREYYRLLRDPWQLKNVLKDGNPDNNPSRRTLTKLHRQLVDFASCAAKTCP
jgi:arylsulfatase A-like enzyme